MASDRGLELYLNSWWHEDMVCALRLHKEADVLGILKMYHEMTQLGPHSFCMSHTQGRILWFTWKIEWLVPECWRMKLPLEAPQVELDVQAEHFAMVPTIQHRLCVTHFSIFSYWPVLCIQILFHSLHMMIFILAVVQWLPLLPHSKKVLGPNLLAGWGLSVWSPCACVGFFQVL